MNNYIEPELDIFDILKTLYDKILIIAIAAVLGMSLMGAYSLFVAKPTYESTSKIYVLTQSTSITSLTDIQLSSSLAKDYEKMIMSRPVVRQVIDSLGLDYTYEEMRDNKVEITNPEDTRVLEITCRSNDAEEAKAMANEFAVVSKRQIANIMDTDEPTIFERAVVSQHPVSPKTGLNVLIGFLLGVILSSIVIVLVDVTNNYLRTEEDVERHLKLNVLVSIPYEETEGEVSNETD